LPNFPDHQRTGSLTELDVLRLFTEWHWNAGKDQIDSGYDLCVGPDHIKYNGARFMVQVKGTAKSKAKGSVTAPVSKNRLRQYAQSVLPVFIVRVTAEGEMYWCHAQAWARANVARMAGDGTTGVKIDKANDLKDREAFEVYLAKAFQDSPTLGRPVSEWERKADFLNSLDPNLGVRVQTTDSGTRLSLFAKQESSFNGKFSFEVARSDRNFANARDALKFGLPREVEAFNFKITGSPLFDHVPSRFDKGMLKIGTTPEERNCVRLYPGTKRSVVSSVLPIDVEIYRGKAGLALTSERLDSLFDLIIKMEPKSGEILVDITMGLRQQKLARLPIREFDALRSLTDWVDHVLVQDSMFLDAGAGESRLPLLADSEQLEVLMPMLEWFQALSRLHLVANCLHSDFTLPENAALTSNEHQEIELAYALLKGDRCPIRFHEVTITTPIPAERLPGSNLLCTTTLMIVVQGQELGSIPVAIELSGVEVLQLPGSGGLRITSAPGCEAWMSFHDGTSFDANRAKPPSVTEAPPPRRGKKTGP